ncbi:MAG: hypothetical protein A3D92_07885 [Bacteroidetes bacterium RIFCSPHIGHO2_02_FULL_44_7]|nr:MAG: hypothetical protein A3D92_07885 [Bacteroidetes bacterium RIFCSPHIGHO2_02_FULL_44_7]
MFKKSLPKMNKMKIVRVLLLAGLLVTASSCNKDIQKMEVIKDCTGVYVRDKNGQDRKVCNAEILDGIATGTKIKISYDKMEQCFGLIDGNTCEMAHLYVGVLEITEIH